MGVRLWVIGSLSIGRSLLPAFSRVVYYWPLLMTMMSDVRMGYPIGTSNQLCYFFVILTRSIAHCRSRLDLLTVQSLLFRVRMSNFNLLLLSPCRYIPLVGAVIAVFTAVY